MGKTTFTLTAILLLPLLACAHHAATPAVENSQRLEERRDAFLAALSARELEATMAFFSEDAVVHVAGFAPLRGRDAIRPFYANVFRFLSESESTPESIRVSRGGDMAWGVGSVVNIFEGAEGRSEHTGKYLLVWEERDGEWWIAAYSVSSNRPEPGR